MNSADNSAVSILYDELNYDYYANVKRFNGLILSVGFAIELLFFGLYLGLDLIEYGVAQYIIYYMVRPLIPLSIIYIISQFICKQYLLRRDYTTAYKIQLTFLSIALGIMIWVHYVFPCLYLLSILPLVFTIFIGNKKLVDYTFVISMITTGAAFFGTVFDKFTDKPPKFLFNIILTFIILFIFWQITLLIIQYEDRKRAITQQSINYAVNMEEKASTDGLTGILNRAGLDELVVKVIDRYDMNIPVFLAMIDIDFFKRANDTYGHQFGDIVLRRLGNILSFREGDTIRAGRYGGEEFVILFESIPKDKVFGVLKRIKHEFDSTEYDDNDYKGTISIGVYEYKGKGNATRLIRHADKALYYAKEHGRNQIIYKNVNDVYEKVE